MCGFVGTAGRKGGIVYVCCWRQRWWHGIGLRGGGRAALSQSPWPHITFNYCRQHEQNIHDNDHNHLHAGADAASSIGEEVVGEDVDGAAVDGVENTVWHSAYVAPLPSGRLSCHRTSL